MPFKAMDGFLINIAKAHMHRQFAYQGAQIQRVLFRDRGRGTQ